MRNIFHRYNLYINLYSGLLYLLTSSVNILAVKYGMSYFWIGFMDFTGAVFYLITTLLIGHLGDKFGHKKLLLISQVLFIPILIYGFLLSNVFSLYIMVIGFNIFYAFYYSTNEGLLAKQEKNIGIETSWITTRFTLSWSSGNIFGMALGPILIQNISWMVFTYGISLSLISCFFIYKDLKKNSEKFTFTMHKKLYKKDIEIDFPKIRLYRNTYRFNFLLGGVLFTTVLHLFPKVLIDYNIKVSFVGFILAFSSIGVFLTFLTLTKFKMWVGNPKISLYLLAVFPLLTILFFIPVNTISLIFLIFMVGVVYATPYTFALFYGLNSKENDHSKQGSFHEAMVGLSNALGPLLGGIFLQLNPEIWSLGILSLILTILLIVSQINFFRKIH